MRNNKGISLVELIIVIAIITLFAGGSIAGIQYLHYAGARQCVNEMDAAIEKVRMEAMSKTNKPYLYLYQYQNAYYMKVLGADIVDPELLLDEKGTKVANRRLTLCYRTSTMNSGDTDLVLTDMASGGGHYIKLGFIKSTGGIAPLSDSSYYSRILVKNQEERLLYTITLVQATGKHSIRKGD